MAIVTGGGSGIGRATARRMAAEGASVVVADISSVSAEETVAEVRDAGGTATAVWVDVAEEDAVVAMVDATIDAYGALHVLHNNAANVGIVPRDSRVHDMDVAVWDETMATNLRGPMLGTKHSIPHMLAAGGGSIVNTSSTTGQMGELTRVAYGVSKAGVESLTKNTATIYGKRGIRCNAVAPSVIRTPSLAANIPDAYLDAMEASLLTPYLGEPADVAAMVTFLASDEARFVTGQIINVDGGWLSHNPTYADFTRRSTRRS